MRKDIILTSSIISMLMIALMAVLPVHAACDRDGTSNNNGNGNDNTIVCDSTNSAGGNLVRGRGGANNITIAGDDTAGTVRGDAGNDTITVEGTAGAVNGNGGQDTITINGTADSVNGGGDVDTININGTVNGDVRGGGGQDTFIIGNNAEITGTINGNAGTDILIFDMVLCETNFDVDALNTEIESSSASDSITIGTVTYTWVSITTFEGGIIPRDCSEPQDIIPGFTGFTDGRLNGLLCPIWLSGSSMMVFDTTGMDGVIVTTVDLSASVASNTLLVQNNAGTVSVYQLTSGELQVQCNIWDSFNNVWKVDNYIFQNFSDYAPEIIR